MGTTMCCRHEIHDEEALVRALALPAAYGDAAGRVEHLQTHISHLFLTDRCVYKLKKPVRFDFLDFSTVDARRRACEDEVRLNRRLAPGVYLNVLPVAASQGDGYRVGQTGPAVDWVVQMRRLSAERAMDVRIRRGDLPIDDIQRLADHLARFYAGSAPIVMRSTDYRQALLNHIVSNADDLMRSSDDAVRLAARRATAAQLRFIQLCGDELDRRVQDGCVIEGHGDLRPEHVYFTPDPVVIDCIEFSRDLRTVDAADDLAFLAMECERLGRGDVEAILFAAYRRRNNDAPSAGLIAFYKGYRACVRAKVALLRDAQVSEPDEHRQALDLVRQYLELAERYAATFAPPFAIVVRGLSGTGKSTLAESLADSLHLEHLQTDRLRKELFGATTGGAVDAGDYTPERRAAVYARLLQSAQEHLAAGQSVVLDGTFAKAEYLAPLREMAQRLNIPVLIVRCECPRDVALERLASRAARGSSLSDADAAVHLRQRQAFADEPADVPSLVVDTTESLPDQLAAVEQQLHAHSIGLPRPGARVGV